MRGIYEGTNHHWGNARRRYLHGHADRIFAAAGNHAYYHWCWYAARVVDEGDRAPRAAAGKVRHPRTTGRRGSDAFQRRFFVPSRAFEPPGFLDNLAGLLLPKPHRLGDSTAARRRFPPAAFLASDFCGVVHLV